MNSINIKDIAKLAGVGVSTVSRAINNHPDVNQKTKQKIMKIIKDNNYVPNNSARNLKRIHSNTIGVLIKGITNPFFSRMIKVIEQKINENHATMLLHQVESSVDELDDALEICKEKRLQGLIFLGGNFEQNEEKWKELKVPFVLSTITGSDHLDKTMYSSVTIDDFKESFAAVDYLCKLGHRNIGLLAAEEDDQSISKLRMDGYCRALEENGIPVRKEYICHTSEFTPESGYAMASELIDKFPELTCLFCISDLMAIGACKAVFDSGKRVPEDYSVMGFDGLDFAQFYHPTIATVKQPAERIALESVNILFRMIADKKFSEHKVFRADLIEGKSCGKPRSK